MTQSLSFWCPTSSRTTEAVAVSLKKGLPLFLSLWFHILIIGLLWTWAQRNIQLTTLETGSDRTQQGQNIIPPVRFHFVAPPESHTKSSPDNKTQKRARPLISQSPERSHWELPTKQKSFVPKKKEQEPEKENEPAQSPSLPGIDNPAVSQDSGVPGGLGAFLPESSQEYKNQLRQEAAQPKANPFIADGGDIPIQNDSPPPIQGSKIQPRYGEKDLSLYQFTEEFRSRFGSLWNMQNRFLPQTSMLRPGNVVYYKVYIHADGTLDKWENITQALHPNMRYDDIDSVFDAVIHQVFPMTLPSHLHTDSANVVTDIVAIQVVGDNQPIRFSF